MIIEQLSERPPITALYLSGEIDLEARDALRETLLHIISTGSSVKVDLTAATFLDSEALGALINGYNAARSAGVGFALTGAQGTVRRVLELTGVLNLAVDPSEW